MQGIALADVRTTKYDNDVHSQRSLHETEQICGGVPKCSAISYMGLRGEDLQKDVPQYVGLFT